MANLGYIQVVRTCNQKCRFCSNPDREYQITIDELKERVDDLVGRGYDGIILTGGEPTECKELVDLIRHATDRGIHVRMITNGQNTADRNLVETLSKAGLGHVHVSVHSPDPGMQGFLTGKPDSLECIHKSLANFLEYGINVDINVTIQHYNAQSLHVLIRDLCGRFPSLHHFVFNNLDPTSNRVAEYPDCIPKLWEFELSLLKALAFLARTGRSFRVERVPLCYMTEFAWASTETRKIVKREERLVHFLDERGSVRQTNFEHGKAPVCSVCRLNPICAGLYEMDRFYQSQELYPVFVDPQPIRRKILSEGD